MLVHTTGKGGGRGTLSVRGQSDGLIPVIVGELIVRSLYGLFFRFDRWINQGRNSDIAVAGIIDSIQSGIRVEGSTAVGVDAPFDRGIVAVFVYGTDVHLVTLGGNELLAVQSLDPGILYIVGIITGQGNGGGCLLIGDLDCNGLTPDGLHAVAGGDNVVVGVALFVGLGGERGTGSVIDDYGLPIGRSHVVPLVGNLRLAVQGLIVVFGQDSQGGFRVGPEIDQALQVGLPGQGLLAGIRLHGEGDGVGVAICTILGQRQCDFVIAAGIQAEQLGPLARLQGHIVPEVRAGLATDRSAVGGGNLRPDIAGATVSHIVQDGRGVVKGAGEEGGRERDRRQAVLVLADGNLEGIQIVGGILRIYGDFRNRGQVYAAAVDSQTDGLVGSRLRPMDPQNAVAV